MSKLTLLAVAAFATAAFGSAESPTEASLRGLAAADPAEGLRSLAARGPRHHRRHHGLSRHRRHRGSLHRRGRRHHGNRHSRRHHRRYLEEVDETHAPTFVEETTENTATEDFTSEDSVSGDDVSLASEVTEGSVEEEMELGDEVHHPTGEDEEFDWTDIEDLTEDFTSETHDDSVDAMSAEDEEDAPCTWKGRRWKGRGRMMGRWGGHRGRRMRRRMARHMARRFRKHGGRFGRHGGRRSGHYGPRRFGHHGHRFAPMKQFRKGDNSTDATEEGQEMMSHRQRFAERMARFNERFQGGKGPKKEKEEALENADHAVDLANQVFAGDFDYTDADMMSTTDASDGDVQIQDGEDGDERDLWFFPYYGGMYGYGMGGMGLYGRGFYGRGMYGRGFGRRFWW